MKYIFFGTPQFAEIVLKKLINSGMKPKLVVCNPDKPTGRKKVLTAPPTKVLAEEHNIPVYQPQKLSVEDFKKDGTIPYDGADVGVLAAYGKIVPKEIIDLFPKGIVVVHPSLLPKYRGATPIRSAMLAGEEVMGATLFLMDEEVDHGPILASQELEILNPNFENLNKQLAELSANLLVKTLPKYLAGEVEPEEQDHPQATFTKKFTTEDAKIDYPNLLTYEVNRLGEVDRKIKAFNPEPGAWTISGEPQLPGFPAPGKRVKLLESEIQDGKLVIKKIQVEGKNPKTIL